MQALGHDDHRVFRGHFIQLADLRRFQPRDQHGVEPLQKSVLRPGGPDRMGQTLPYLVGRSVRKAAQIDKGSQVGRYVRVGMGGDETGGQGLALEVNHLGMGGAVLKNIVLHPGFHDFSTLHQHGFDVARPRGAMVTISPPKKIELPAGVVEHPDDSSAVAMRKKQMSR